MATWSFDDDDLFTTEEAAELLGVSSATLKKWRPKRVGPEYLKMEGMIRYTGYSLRAYRRRVTIRTNFRD